MSTNATTQNITQSVSTTGQAANSAFVVPLSTTVAQAAGIESSSFTLPVTLPANTTITAHTGQPANITPFSSMRAAFNDRTTQSVGIPAATARLYYVINPPSDVVLSGSYQFSFSLHDAPSTTDNYYIASYDGSTWIANATGSAATISGKTLTFGGTFPSSLTLSANRNYAFVIYTLPLITSSSVSTVTSGTSPSVKGLIDGAVTLTLPLSTSPVVLQYTSTETVPSGIPNLAEQSGISEVPGYITITPTADVTFPAGQSVVLHHPTFLDNHSNNSGTPAPASSLPTGANSGSGGIDNSTHGGGDGLSDPLLAVYDTTRANPAWVLGFGTFKSDGVTDSLSYALPATVTLKGNTTYAFAVYK